MIVFLILDVANAKVLAVHQHFVKPRTSDVSESILTEECRQETGLHEDQIRHAQPLENVLEEVDRFLKCKGLHPDHGGRPFCFCTDGELHFRQVLFPESCTKGITLPDHFHSFFDLRTEFHKHYRTAEPPDGLPAMLEYLGLAVDNTVEFGVRHANVMAAIILRLLGDGHEFKEPDVVKNRLEAGICRRDDDIDDNTVVRARGLPWQASDQDIANFFRGHNIAKGGVAICLSNQGRRNGEALIKLETESQRNLALRRHKHHIGQRYIEVYRATGRDFLAVAGGANEDAHKFLAKGGDVIIRMRGLPFTATAKDVIEFFNRAEKPPAVLHDEEGILFVKYHDGRSTGDAFVLFDNETESKRALVLHREVMGSRYIELFKSTAAEVQQVLNRSLDPNIKPPGEMNAQQQQQQQAALLAQLPLLPQQLITAGCVRDCIRLRGLCTETQVTDILSFLAECAANIAFQGVHMVYNAQGQPAGEAFIQMTSEKAAAVAAHAKNGRQMSVGRAKRAVEVLQCSGEDMHLVLTGGLPQLAPATLALQPALPPTALQPAAIQPAAVQQAVQPTIQQQQQIITIGGHGMIPPSALTGAMMPTFTTLHQQITQTQTGGSPTAMTPQLTPTHPSPLTPTVPQSMANGLNQALTSPLSQMASLASMNGMNRAGQQQLYHPQLLYFYPSPPVSPTTAAAGAATCGGYVSVQTHIIMMRGLPFNASIQDVLNFFTGFPEMRPEQVQLQRGSDGRPTGDAFITFFSRVEAERAVSEKNRHVLGNKLIQLYMTA